MRVLALDTTTPAGSVAIVDDRRVVYEQSGDPARSHAERLPADVMTALDAAGLSSSDIDVFAVASGPGSFTGIRIGIATVQGLALVHRRRVVPVSVLAALAEAGAERHATGALVGAWMDARRGEVYSALWRVSGVEPYAVDHLEALEPPAAGSPAAAFDRWAQTFGLPAIVIGDGAVLYAGAIDGRAPIEASPLMASVIGQMAVARARAGQTVDPAGIQPLYVRRLDAEVIRDRAAGTTAPGVAWP